MEDMDLIYNMKKKLENYRHCKYKEKNKKEKRQKKKTNED